MMPHSVLFRYLMRNFLKWTGIVGFAMTTIIMLFDFAELVRKGSSKSDVGFSVLLKMLFLKTPYLCQQIFPFMILFSSLLMLWKLNRHQELTVMKAAGMSIWQIIAPLTSAAWIIGAVDLLVLNPVTSRMMLRYEHMDGQYFQNNMESLTVSESGIWIRERKEDIQQVLQISHIDRQKNTVQKISLFQFNLQDQFLKRIEARSGYFKKGNLLVLSEVWQQRPHFMPQYKDILEVPTNLSVLAIQNTGISPGSVSFWDLPHVSTMLEISGLSGHKYRMYWHSLLARWMWLGIMVILAASCSLQLVRSQKTFMAMGIGAGCAFLLYFLREATYALGNAGILPISLAAWTPAGISALLGLTALLYFEEG